MSTKTGQCMCGAVKFTANIENAEFGACHCEMCRRWTGSAFLGVTVPVDEISFSGEENISQFKSSDWAERASCKICASPLWYKITSDGPMSNSLELSIGLLDESDDLKMVRQIFIDQKPKSFAYSGEHQLMTRAEVMAVYGVNLDED